MPNYFQIGEKVMVIKKEIHEAKIVGIVQDKKAQFGYPVYLVEFPEGERAEVEYFDVLKLSPEGSEEGRE